MTAKERYLAYISSLPEKINVKYEDIVPFLEEDVDIHADPDEISETIQDACEDYLREKYSNDLTNVSIDFDFNNNNEVNIEVGEWIDETDPNYMTEDQVRKLLKGWEDDKHKQFNYAGVIKIIKDHEYNISQEINTDGETEIEISKYSDAGEDFSFNVNITTDDASELVYQIRKEAENFDPEEHAQSWIGGNGAPSLDTLLEDAHDIADDLSDLSDHLQKYEKLGEKGIEKENSNYVWNGIDVSKVKDELSRNMKKSFINDLDTNEIFFYALKHAKTSGRYTYPYTTQNREKIADLLIKDIKQATKFMDQMVDLDKKAKEGR